MNHCVPWKRVLCSGRCIGVGCEDTQKLSLWWSIVHGGSPRTRGAAEGSGESLNGCLCLKWLLPELFTGE